jgi:alpha-1,2-mannosyltransferase
VDSVTSGYHLDPPLATSATSSTHLSPRDRVLGVLGLVALVVGSVGWTVDRRQVDLEVYRLGAAHAFSPSLYHLGLVVAGGPPLPFTYPPTAALLLWPLQWGRTGVVEVLWALLGALCLLVSVRVSLQWTSVPGRSRGWWALVLAGLGVVANPVLQTFAFGQINLLVMALVLLDLGGTWRWRERVLPRGVLVGFAGALKLVPLIWIGYYLVTGQWRRARNATLSFVVVVGLAFVANPTASRQYWFHDIVAQSRIGVVSFVSNQSLQGLLDRLAHRTLASTVVDAAALVVLVFGLFVARRLHARGEVAVAVWTVAVTGLLVSPVSWVHHFVWLWPAAVGLIFRTESRVRVAAVLLGVITVAAPMWWVPHGAPFDLRENALTFVPANAFALSCLLALAGAAVVTRGSRVDKS